ncbi:hypothetical protein [Neobacillus sp. D3-1R]|uniref:hypothetical protein n=1 Tax=Neobacillus sp. D3-1R TaxID=3445778 RepID=UPI003FA109A8
MDFDIHLSPFFVISFFVISVIGNTIQWFLQVNEEFEEQEIIKSRQISLLIIGVSVLTLVTLPTPGVGGVYTLQSDGNTIIGSIAWLNFIRKFAVLIGWVSAISFTIMPLVLYISKRFSKTH